MKTLVLDTNIFILFIIGTISPDKINSDRRTSIYKKEHYDYLLNIMKQYKNIITCPNIFTEVDNLLNQHFWGEKKLVYLKLLKEILDKSIEKYYASKDTVQDWIFEEVGLTDSVIIKMALESDLLISGDSALCEIAKSFGVQVFDFKEYVNLIL